MSVSIIITLETQTLTRLTGNRRLKRSSLWEDNKPRPACRRHHWYTPASKQWRSVWGGGRRAMALFSAGLTGPDRAAY